MINILMLFAESREIGNYLRRVSVTAVAGHSVYFTPPATIKLADSRCVIRCEDIRRFEDIERLRGQRYDAVLVDASFHSYHTEHRTNLDSATLAYEIKARVLRPGPPAPSVKEPTPAEVIAWIERNNTLHRTVEVLYVVDSYEVAITHDGRVIAGPWRKETLMEACIAAMKEWDVTHGGVDLLVRKPTGSNPTS